MTAKPEQYRTGHSGYVSEFSQFINEFMEHHPEVEKDQKRGWYTWWDHSIDLKDLEPQQKDVVPAKSYQYD